MTVASRVGLLDTHRPLINTPVGFLDTQRCSSGEPLSALLSAPPPPLTFEGGAVL